MTAHLVFGFPLGWQIGLPVTGALLIMMAWSLGQTGLDKWRVAALTGLRTVTLLTLVFLAGRPTWVSREVETANKKSVVLLMDRSESMSLEEDHQTRYARALRLAREQVLPALKTAGWQTEALLFAEDVQAADGAQLVAAKPDGRRTNLARAITRALSAAAQPPLAIIALTDGAANESSENSRAVAALVDAHTPFIGIGFGSDTGVETLTLRQAEGPPTAPPRQQFNIGARLEMVNAEDLTPFDLVLMRDGKLTQHKTISPGKGSRSWVENFPVTEETEGTHQYAVQLMPPVVRGLTCVETLATTTVRITSEKELRVLYVQGALTWDYKFINLALRGDPMVKLTGLIRTSSHSVFRQNVESAGELLSGFPSTLEEMAPFRVVVLTNLRPSDLTAAQQEVLARFCSELGGGVLMMGGPATFDSSWQGSRLEQLLPVVFASSRGVVGLDRPFHLQLTDEALQHPVFQVADAGANRAAWERLPTFTEYGRVDAAKPGAQVWALHQEDMGPNGRRILMATQRYGAGLSAVLCVQNFWRWRLAKESDPQTFDRFWRQLFRYLSESSRQDIAIHFADQELRPQSDIRLILEKQPDPKNVTEPRQNFVVHVEDGQGKTVQEQTVELSAGRPVETSFRAEREGTYTIHVLDTHRVLIASRSIQIRDVNVEFQDTARNMEQLRQWASISGGLALRAEDCHSMDDLLAQINERVEQSHRDRLIRRPAGVNGNVLALLLGCLGLEYVLRKHWSLQ